MTIRFFTGDKTRQVDPITGARADPKKWYWEPADHKSDVLYSDAFDDRADAAVDSVGIVVQDAEGAEVSA